MRYLSDVEVVYRSLPSGWTLVFGPVKGGWWYLGTYAAAGAAGAILLGFEKEHHSWWLVGPIMLSFAICVFMGATARRAALAAARANSDCKIRNLEQVWTRVDEVRSVKLEEGLRLVGDVPLSRYVQWVDERNKKATVLFEFPRVFTQGLPILAVAGLGWGVPKNPAFLMIGLIGVLAITGLLLVAQLPTSLKRSRWRDLQYLLRLIEIRQGASDSGRTENEHQRLLIVSHG